MSVSSQSGVFGLKRQSAVGTAATTPYNSADWYWLPALNVAFQPNQMVQSIPPEVGGSLWARGSYKGGVFGGGQVTMVPRAGLGLAELMHAFCGGTINNTAVAATFDAGGAVSSSAVNEVQTMSITGTPGGGTFALIFQGQTTTAIPYNGNSTAVQNALRALTNINGANVNVTGTNPGPFTITFVGTLAGSNVGQITADYSLLTGGTSPTVTTGTTTQGAAAVTSGFVNKLTGDGTNGIASGNFKYRFEPASTPGAELPWYTFIRNVGGKFVEQFVDGHLGSFSFDLTASNILQIDGSFVSKSCSNIGLGSGSTSVGAQIAGNGPVFQMVDATVKLDTNVSGDPGAVTENVNYNPTRLSIGFMNELTQNEFVVGSFFLQDITNISRSAQISYGLYLRDAEIYNRVYNHGAATADGLTGADWSSEIWKGALEVTLTAGAIGATADDYTIVISIPEMDYQAAPITLAGNNLVEFQLTTNVVLSQDTSVQPFTIYYTTDENIS
jgi:hypothetical protein